jgi:hydrogenase maturation factor
MIKLCDVALDARAKLPPQSPDKSGIGVHYTDAFLKPMNTQLADGTRVACKRKGLKITLKVGVKQGTGLMRRVDVSRDPVEMLKGALQEAAKAAGVGLNVTDTEIQIAQ